jgi:hypothetical protein
MEMYAVIVVALIKEYFGALRSGLVVSSPPTTEETGAMGRVIESRLGIGW